MTKKELLDKLTFAVETEEHAIESLMGVYLKRIDESDLVDSDKINCRELLEKLNEDSIEHRKKFERLIQKVVASDKNDY